MEGFILHRLCCRAKKLARKWEGCYNIWSGIWRSDWRETPMELRFEKLKFYSAILLMWISFFLIATTFNTMWLFSRNIVVFVHNILFSTGSIFFFLSHVNLVTLSIVFFFDFSQILSLRNYFLAEGESWILSICVTAILFSLFRLLCILPVSKVIPFFGLRNFLSLFILDWRLKSCTEISLLFFATWWL